jgi:hypothetical protein
MTQFRGETSTTQSIPGATTTQVNFGLEAFDTDNCFASGRLTVPASWDGKYGAFYAGVRFASDENGYVAIEVSTNGGSVWSNVGLQALWQALQCNVQTGPILFNTGDIYRVVLNGSGAIDVNNDKRTFFAGRQIGLTLTDVGFFSATNNGAQSISGGTLTPVTLATEDFDTKAAFASSVFTVPAAFNGKWGVFTGGVEPTGTKSFNIYITKSINGGGSYPTIHGAHEVITGDGIVVSTGPMLLTTGHKYRLETFALTGFTVGNTPATFFSGDMYNPT